MRNQNHEQESQDRATIKELRNEEVVFLIDATKRETSKLDKRG